MTGKRGAPDHPLERVRQPALGKDGRVNPPGQLAQLIEPRGKPIRRSIEQATDLARVLGEALLRETHRQRHRL